MRFFTAIMFFDCNLSNVNPLKCVSMNNQECKTKPKIFHVNIKVYNLMPRTNETRHIEWNETCNANVD